MRALVLEEKGTIRLRDIDIEEHLGPWDVRIEPRVVGICGSDVHYFTDGRIGDFVVESPMVLGHEAAGVVVEIGSEVTTVQVGDRVCMEPGIPNPQSAEYKKGHYNVDPDIKFWATPPVHGVLRESVVHPAEFTFKLPDNVSFAEGAMVEPLAVAVHAVTKAQPSPGSYALVTGAGTVGLLTAMSALAAGCARVIITDTVPEKLAVAETLGAITPVLATSDDRDRLIDSVTGGRGVDVVFECSGSVAAAQSVFDHAAPGATVVFIGLPGGSIPYDVIQGILKEITVKHVFRYAHVYPQALELVASGRIDLGPLLTDRFAFEHSVEAFEAFLAFRPSSIKIQIDMGGGD